MYSARGWVMVTGAVVELLFPDLRRVHQYFYLRLPSPLGVSPASLLVGRDLKWVVGSSTRKLGDGN